MAKLRWSANSKARVSNEQMALLLDGLQRYGSEGAFFLEGAYGLSA